MESVLINATIVTVMRKGRKLNKNFSLSVLLSCKIDHNKKLPPNKEFIQVWQPTTVASHQIHGFIPLVKSQEFVALPLTTPPPPKHSCHAPFFLLAQHLIPFCFKDYFPYTPFVYPFSNPNIIHPIYVAEPPESAFIISFTRSLRHTPQFFFYLTIS